MTEAFVIKLAVCLFLKIRSILLDVLIFCFVRTCTNKLKHPRGATLVHKIRCRGDYQSPVFEEISNKINEKIYCKRCRGRYPQRPVLRRTNKKAPLPRGLSAK